MNTPNTLRYRWLAALPLGTFLALIAAPPVKAADQFPPGKMTFQGFLTDASNPPVPLGNTSPANTTLIFKIYDNAAAGNVKWAESQIVTIDKGHFSVLLGEGSAVSPFPNSADLSGVFTGADASDRWIGITVDGSEVTPRIRFFAAPYAQLARSANSLVSGAQTGVLNATGNVTAEGSLASNGSIAGLIFQDRNGSTAWQWYSEDGKARLWNGGDKITVSNAGVIGSAGLTVSNKNAIELGVGITKEANAGKIGYETFTTGALDITGAGTATPRKIKLWDEIIVPGNATIGGSATLGGVTVNGNATVNGVLAATSLTSSAASPGFKVELTGSNLMAYKSGTTSTTLENTGGGSLNLQTQGGNVGIGTTAAAAKLHVAGGNMKIDGSHYIEFGAGVAGKETAAGKMGYATFTPNPMLDIVGANPTGSNTRYVKVWDALYIDQWAVSPSFQTSSDARIKKITDRPVGETSLESIRRLQVTDFRFVDTKGQRQTPRRGFIAQEIEKVLPNAVTQSTDFVPDIYAPAITSEYEASEKTLTIELKDPHGLNLDDIVRLNLEPLRTFPGDFSLAGVTFHGESILFTRR
jgi:hypothetical protein